MTESEIRSAYLYLLENVRERAREVVLCTNGMRGMAAVSTEVVLTMSKAIHDADRMKLTLAKALHDAKSGTVLETS